MLHLLFLIVSLSLVPVVRGILLLGLGRTQNWWLRRNFQLLAMGLPFTVLALFSLTMFPFFLSSESTHHANELVHTEWTFALIGFATFSLPLLLALAVNLLRLSWLYGRTYRRTWLAPAGLVELATSSPSCTSRWANEKPTVRLWLSEVPFAFNLPGLGINARPIIVLSTTMVSQLTTLELQAVLWHEIAHLHRRDF